MGKGSKRGKEVASRTRREAWNKWPGMSQKTNTTNMSELYRNLKQGGRETEVQQPLGRRGLEWVVREKCWEEPQVLSET